MATLPATNYSGGTVVILCSFMEDRTPTRLLVLVHRITMENLTVRLHLITKSTSAIQIFRFTYQIKQYADTVFSVPHDGLSFALVLADIPAQQVSYTTLLSTVGDYFLLTTID